METIEHLLKVSISFLKEKGIDEARRTAELLLAHALRCNRIDLYLRFDKPLGDEELERYRGFIRRRLHHEPTQYIIGTTEFYGVELEVSPAALIPRPDTETLVTEVLDVLKSEFAESAVSIADIGTGTGAIPIAILSQFATADITAVDISPDALSLAKRNAENNAINGAITFVEADFLSDMPLPGAPYTVLISNPPYIPKEEFAILQPEVRDFEPSFSTTDNADGLTFYRRIAARAHALVVPGGHIIVEIGYGQGQDVRKIFESAGLEIIRAVRDLAGIERVVHARVK